MTLPDTVVAGQAGHVTDHNTIKDLLDAKAPAAAPTLTGNATIGGAVFKAYPGAAAPKTVQIEDHVVVSSRLGVSTEPSPRLPVSFAPTMDGSAMTAANPGNKVGNQNSVTFVGGFTAEAGYGVPDPTFLFGANDFIITGPSAGAVAGITDLYGRLTETHLYAPNTTLTNVIGLQAEAHVEPEAAGSTVQNVIAFRALAPRSAGSTVTNVYSAYFDNPIGGTGSNNRWAAFFAGKVEFAGDTPNAQSIGRTGVFVGKSGGLGGIDISTTNLTYRIDNDGTSLRFLQAGIAVMASINAAGHLTLNGGLTFNPATSTSASAGTNGAAPAQVAGYATVTIAGQARKIAYYLP